MNTKSWTCDTCGGIINQAADGWIEWLDKYENGKRTGRGLRLVHNFASSPRSGQYKCQYDGDKEYQNDGMTLSDLDLPSVQEADGLMDLLSMLSDDELPKMEVIEMIKRIHIPGYEKARNHFQNAIAEGVFEPNTKPGFYPQRDIAATIEWAEQAKETQ